MAEEYALQLAANKTTLFALSIDNFVQSTIESEETDPFVVMRNVRQFMSGMINYLTINYKDKFQRMAEMKRRQVSAVPGDDGRRLHSVSFVVTLYIMIIVLAVAELRTADSLSPLL